MPGTLDQRIEQNARRSAAQRQAGRVCLGAVRAAPTRDRVPGPKATFMLGACRGMLRLGSSADRREATQMHQMVSWALTAPVWSYASIPVHRV